MPKGGARVRSGPPPDPNALTARDGEWVKLPATGRAGAVPEWPLIGQSEREGHLWASLWVLPQALMWEREQQFMVVALYVRRLVEAEVPGSPVAVSTLCRQLADSLGLTSPGLRANRWIIGDVEAARSKPVASKSRARLKVVGADVEGA